MQAGETLPTLSHPSVSAAFSRLCLSAGKAWVAGCDVWAPFPPLPCSPRARPPILCCGEPGASRYCHPGCESSVCLEGASSGKWVCWSR